MIRKSLSDSRNPNNKGTSGAGESLDESNETLFDLAFDPGKWFRLTECLINNPKLGLGGNEVILLALLMNEHYKWKVVYANQGVPYLGWFYLRTASIKKRIRVEKRTQMRQFGRLIEAGCIETVKAGRPARRWIRIKRPKIISALS